MWDNSRILKNNLKKLNFNYCSFERIQEHEKFYESLEELDLRFTRINIEKHLETLSSLINLKKLYIEGIPKVKMLEKILKRNLPVVIEDLSLPEELSRKRKGPSF